MLGPIGFISTNGSDDAFVCKHDSIGNFIWAKAIGGASWDRGKDVTTDLIGNIYVTGIFYLSMTPLPNVTLNAVGSDDLFICKINKNGEIVWVKSGGGTAGDELSSIFYKNNHLYLAGYFYNTVDFDFNSGIYNLASTGNNDIFISKITDGGDFVWAKKIGGSNGDISGNIIVDNKENIFFTGFYSDYGDFNNGAKKSVFGNGALIEKFSQTTAPLPIHLISFEGVPQPNFNQITWTTASENNHAYFLLEKSEDGKQWLEITKIPGEAASNESKKYEYKDYTITSLSNYYRLKQVDLDTKVSFSKTIVISQSNFENNGLGFYPNPTSGLITVENPDLNSDIELFDTKGMKIKVFKTKSVSTQINLSSLPKGIYFLKAESDKNLAKKVVLE